MSNLMTRSEAQMIEKELEQELESAGKILVLDLLTMRDILDSMNLKEGETFDISELDRLGLVEYPAHKSLHEHAEKYRAIQLKLMHLKFPGNMFWNM